MRKENWNPEFFHFIGVFKGVKIYEYGYVKLIAA